MADTRGRCQKFGLACQRPVFTKLLHTRPREDDDLDRAGWPRQWYWGGSTEEWGGAGEPACALASVRSSSVDSHTCTNGQAEFGTRGEINCVRHVFDQGNEPETQITSFPALTPPSLPSLAPKSAAGRRSRFGRCTFPVHRQDGLRISSALTYNSPSDPDFRRKPMCSTGNNKRHYLPS
ncbi:unnamed protein product [Protopolystoma xenopodis]|uniref:Uncharacterized protein n=1 Tax=Protopolystoma xenopodis TaxID=117903 RepID=A0A448WF85_9PLAT|nr:unnamed protein product [Protopolystoma xenopodis]